MMSSITVLQTPLFLRKKKKLTKNQRKDLDNAVRVIIKSPEAGTQKKGDLKEIWVYKFNMAKQKTLLAYQWDAEKRILVALGVHENFYRDLRR